MKDLDFDELDRAVNSLLTNKSAPADDKAVTPLVDLAASTDSAVDDVATPPPVAQPAPLAARRSSGRFMDVVHPSSDMRTTSTSVKSVSREGVGIAPPVNDFTDMPMNSNPVPVMPVSEVEEPELTVDDDPQPVVHEWPDPIDFSSPTVPADVEPSTELLAADSDDSNQPETLDDDKDINQIADAINKTLSQDLDSQAPLESPFLSDTKVEKRPLGAFSTEATAPVVDDVPTVEPVVASLSDSSESFLPMGEDNSKHQDDPIDDEIPLPAELQDDLLLIEAGNAATSQPNKEDLTPVAVLSPEVPAGPTYITQQYTEQPSTGDQPAGAIFDTEAYRKPLAHPAKKKSGWLLVLWIALLLIVGAGAGVAVYFYVLPMF